MRGRYGGAGAGTCWETASSEAGSAAGAARAEMPRLDCIPFCARTCGGSFKMVARQRSAVRGGGAVTLDTTQSLLVLTMRGVQHSQACQDVGREICRSGGGVETDTHIKPHRMLWDQILQNTSWCAAHSVDIRPFPISAPRNSDRGAEDGLSILCRVLQKGNNASAQPESE